MSARKQRQAVINICTHMHIHFFSSFSLAFNLAVGVSLADTHACSQCYKSIVDERNLHISDRRCVVWIENHAFPPCDDSLHQLYTGERRSMHPLYSQVHVAVDIEISNLGLLGCLIAPFGAKYIMLKGLKHI